MVPVTRPPTRSARCGSPPACWASSRKFSAPALVHVDEDGRPNFHVAKCRGPNPLSPLTPRGAGSPCPRSTSLAPVCPRQCAPVNGDARFATPKRSCYTPRTGEPMWSTRLIAGAFVLGTGCGHVAAHVPHPLDNQVRYLCCNLHYDKPQITDMNYLRGKVIPFGTRVQIREVDADRVEFQTPGHPPIRLVLKQGVGELTMDQYLDRIFLVDDPYARLPKLPEDGKAAAEVDKIRRMTEEGDVTVGMTRDQVLMAIGYPPAHR